MIVDTPYTRWKATKKNTIAEPDGKIFIFNFDKVFAKPQLAVYNKFIIKKKSYVDQLGLITKHINFFISDYDHDNELATAYLKLKFAIDREKMFTKDNMELIINTIYEFLFTDTMIEKIERMVDDTYVDDIENNPNKKNYKPKNVDYLESLEYKNIHVKILLRIGFGIKIICPIMLHYLMMNDIHIPKGNLTTYQFYEKLFYILNNSDEYEDVPENAPADYVPVRKTIDIYNKMFTYTKAKVIDSKCHNPLMYDRREIFGKDEYTIIEDILKCELIGENMVKYEFNKQYNERENKFKENIIGFNKTIINHQLRFARKETYEKNLAEVTNVKNAEGLSGADKMEMNSQKLDEGIIIFAEMNVASTLKSLQKIFDIDISKDEIDYYIEYHKPSPIQIQLVRSYYAKYFGGFRNLKLTKREEYNILLVLLKKKLLIESGYRKKLKGVAENAKLPYVLCGNVNGVINTRIIRNSKFIEYTTNTQLYKHLSEHKYKKLLQIKPGYLLELMSTFINTKFTYVTYEDQSLLGQEITYSEYKISDELLLFLNNI